MPLLFQHWAYSREHSDSYIKEAFKLHFISKLFIQGTRKKGT